MNIITIFLVVVFILAAIFLTAVILLQDEQGEGLGGIFGGGSSTPFGSRSGNVLTRFTSVLGVVFLVCAFGIAWFNRSQEAGDVLGAAKRSQAGQSNSWWLAPVSSDAQLPTDQPGVAAPGESTATPLAGTPMAPTASVPAPAIPAAPGALPLPVPAPTPPPATSAPGSGLAN